MISLLSIAAVAMICAFTYRHLKKAKDSDAESDAGGSELEDSLPNSGEGLYSDSA